jgi:type IV pilus assembly protein PilF
MSRSLPFWWQAWAAWLVGLSLVLGGCQSTSTVDGFRVDPKNPIPGTSEGDAHRRAAVRLQLAADYYQSGQLQTAIDTAQTAVQVDPQYAAAYGLLGLMYADANQPDKAQDSFARAMSLTPNDPELQNNYGWYLCLRGQEDAALPYFDRAASNPLYRTPAVAWQNQGICLRRVHRQADAEKSLLRAFALDAGSPTIKFQLTNLYLLQKRLDRADFYYDLLTRSQEPNAEILWLGVRVAHAHGDADTEHRLAEQLQTRFPGSAQADLLHRGRFDE